MNDEKKIMRFELSPKDIKIKNLLNQQFLYVEIDAINSMYPNLNESHFTPKSLDNCIPTVYNKPILAHYINGKDEFGSHDDNGLQYDKELDNYYYDYSQGNVEIPIGLVREQDNVHTIVDQTTGLTHLIVPCAIWCAYNYKACKKLLKSNRTRVSVEIEVTDYHYDDKSIEIIDAFVLMGITLLGSDIREAVTGSHLSVPEIASTSVFQAQTKRLKFAYQELDKQNHSEQKIEKPDNDKPIPNENVDRISMDEPEDRTSRYSEISVADLTYEQKKSLIAQEFMRLEDDADFWIADISNTYVIIYYHSDDEHCNYKVGYIIDDDPNHTVHLDWDNKEKVIQTWKTFEKDNDSINTNKIFDSKEDTPEMREVFKRDCEQSDIKADESPMDNNTPDSKAKFESKDIVENPGPEMGIVMAAEGECDKTEKEACNPEDQCKNSCDEPEKNCNSEEPDDSDDSCKEKCAKEDSCDDKMCNSEEGCKEEESCPEDKQDEVRGDKEVEGCNPEDKETEGCEDKQEESCDLEKKEEEGCKETEGCNPEDQCKNSCPEDECKMSDDPNGEHFSDDPHGEHFATVNVHGEDLNINQLLEKFTALEDSYNNLKEKYSAFEMKEFKVFALDTINKESRLLDETKTSVRDEVMNAISCGKFSTKDEVEKFTVQSMAMALFNQKEVESADNTEKETKDTKSDFEATIVKNPIGADENKVKKVKTGIDSLLEANNALKFV